ncbi:hypothetical protein CCAX7_44850 [Capsulimonas corticalis]|uniref:Uncharacterized protein n=1 Tax=Capsulimonas corticalis TaxID=2219043 RepID=A0A402CX61_9BACT|nr:hypothetical protein CCAX7_44850 [Capsulimonas corticalis]
MTQEDRDRIEKQGWTDEQLDLGGKPLFTRHGDGYQLAHRADGSCVFLEKNLCRIHAKYGEPAKPVACRMYPFAFVPLGDDVRVDVRFDCPATAKNLGRPITAHRADLQKLIKPALPEDAAALPAPPLYGRVHLSWSQLARITETFERVLLDVSLDITRRITACVNLAAVLRHPRIVKLTEEEFEEFLDDVAAEVQSTAAADTLRRKSPTGPEHIAFRQLAGLYGRYDRVGEKAHLTQRLSVSLAMLSGKGAVPAVRAGFPEVEFQAMERETGVPTPEAAQVLERYLHTHLSSMGFFGPAFYGRSYLDGISALLLTYPLICWYARAYAASEDLPAPTASCIERALMIVDHQHGASPLLDIPTERFRTNMLTERGALRTLVIWYGS